MMLAGTPSVHAAEPCEAMIEQSNQQLDAMRRHAAAIEESLRGLSDSLRRAEQRNVDQTRQIERLEAELRAQRAVDSDEQERQRREFFRALRRRLPVSTLYEVLPDRLIIAADPVFIFGNGQIGAEGQDRLTPLADTLRGLVAQLPPDFPWRLRIEGHSDSRPLRSNSHFNSNWELSAARAVSMLRFLVAQGLPEDRLSAVGLADTELRDLGDSAASHRRNRRIEIRLVYGALPPS
ncbi:MAG: OmpA family protein [Chromatiaceae bacterium]|nr:OmpA family protein [Chromatiaceae bacterium]MCP5421456.1 OmpA family protein [Chromatiaceae bacterium]